MYYDTSYERHENGKIIGTIFYLLRSQNKFK